jgi:hypothetical protein
MRLKQAAGRDWAFPSIECPIDRVLGPLNAITDSQGMEVGRSIEADADQQTGSMRSLFLWPSEFGE